MKQIKNGETKMKKSLPKDFEFLLPVEGTYLDIIKNEDEFVKSWEKFKKNHKKSIITNHVDIQFHNDCEKFTDSIIKTRTENKELDQNLQNLALRIKKWRKSKN